jgi:ribosomal protein L11 methyltransferase
VYELVLSVGEALAEPVSDALSDELGALAVSVEDADAGGDLERALFGEPGAAAPRGTWQHSTMRALFSDETQATEAATLLLAQAWVHGVHVQSLTLVPDADWVRVTQSQFAPVPVTDTFWIVPSWHRVPAHAERVIRVDPGLAFGTGTHPTTRMCLRWVAKNARDWTRVLDYGCGSGILAIGAALHGAHSVDAVDIDPAAVDSTLANARANSVSLRVGAPELARGPYDLVLANILAQPLKMLAPLLAGHLAPGASLVLAGILERQAAEMRVAYAPWCSIDVCDSQDGWILMSGAREANP